MKQTKQFLRPLLMAIVMMVGMLVPQGAWAAEVVTIDGITFSYDVEGDGITIYDYDNGDATYVEVPEEINGKPVTKIGGSAFYGKSNLRVVVLPASITTLGGYIFGGTDLFSLEFKGENPPADIDENAFEEFDKSNLSIVVPEGRVEAYQEALEKWFAPEKFVTKMPDLPIIKDDIEYRITDADSKYVSLFKGSAASGDITIPATIPDDKGVEYTVTEVAGSAFDSNEDLTSVTIPSTVQTIGNWAFFGCSNLATVTLSEGVHALGTNAFRNTALTFIVLPASLTSIDLDAFSECNNLGYMVFKGNKPTLHTHGFLRNRTAPITLYVKDLSQWDTTDKLGAMAECEVTYKSLSDYCSDVHGGHDFASKTLTDEPDEHGLHAYACDNGCGEHNDAHIIKDFNGEGNHLALAKDGEGYSAESVIIEDGKPFYSPVEFTTRDVDMGRQFTQSIGDAVVPATIMLPFRMEAGEVSTVNPQGVRIGTKFYSFTSLDYNSYNDRWEANMDIVIDELEAYTPYMVVLTDGEEIPFGNAPVTFTQTPAEMNNISSSDGEWSFVATNEAKVWTAADFGHGEAYYGFAAGNETTPEGKFVKVGTGASIDPLRAYIMKNVQTRGSASNAPSRALTASQLPSTIGVRLNETYATGIGTLNTETGEFTFDGWYDLQGRRISEPVKNGISIKNDKKIIVK